MKNNINSTVRLALLFTGIILHGVSIAQGFSTQIQTRFQNIIDSFQNNQANPYIGGMSVSINVDGLAEWKGSTGYASRNVDANNNLLPGGSPFEINTRSRVYSVTKTFTSALVIELASEGSFNLDDPIINYIPLGTINPGLDQTVTIRQLLAHESGFSDYTNELMLQIAVAFQPTHTWTPFEMLSFVHQVSAPGSQRRYSSTNYIVLGAIVEIATGMPVEQHFRTRFFNRLHLPSMSLDIREPLPAGTPLAAPHDNLSPFNPIFQMLGQLTYPNGFTNISSFPFTAVSSLAFTSGGIISDVSDMAKWSNHLFAGRAVSQNTLNVMMNSISSTPDPDGDKLGYGIFTNDKISATEFFVGHNGNATGYRSLMFYQPDRKMTIAILSNYAGAKLYDVARVLFEALPAFLCGGANPKERKILVCQNGKTLCVARSAASVLIQKGAWLGSCEASPSLTGKSNGLQIAEPLKNFWIYPNPASGTVRLRFRSEETGAYEINIYDLGGKKITSLFQESVEKDSTRTITFDTSKLSGGLYFASLLFPDGRKITEKLLVNE